MTFYAEMDAVAISEPERQLQINSGLAWVSCIRGRKKGVRKEMEKEVTSRDMDDMIRNPIMVNIKYIIGLSLSVLHH